MDVESAQAIVEERLRTLYQPIYDELREHCSTMTYEMIKGQRKIKKTLLECYLDGDTEKANSVYEHTAKQIKKRIDKELSRHAQSQSSPYCPNIAVKRCYEIMRERTNRSKC